MIINYIEIVKNKDFDKANINVLNYLSANSGNLDLCRKDYGRLIGEIYVK